MSPCANVQKRLINLHIDCRHYAYENGVDSPAFHGWTWPL